MVKRNVFLVLILVTVVTAGAYAGTLKGKVSSMTKSGVVYVDRIAGKTFPATTVPYQIDQHGQSFEPRVLVIPQGATVVFKNSDTVAHNVRWPAICTQPGHLGVRRQSQVPLRSARCRSSAVQYACGDGWIYHRGAHAVLRVRHACR